MAIKIISEHKNENNGVPEPGTANEPSANAFGTTIDFPPLQCVLDPSQACEDDVAEQFAAQNEKRLRHDHDIGRWFVFEGDYWREDVTRSVIDDVRRLCRETRKGRPRLGSRHAINGVEELARCDRRLSIISSQWDQNPWLLGTPGGTIDLKTGGSRGPKPEDFISKRTSVSPAPKGAASPLFDSFLQEVTAGDPQLKRFLQQCAGYFLTGLTREQKLLFIYGPGGNGKSVFLNTLGAILGDYSATAAMDTFTPAAQGRHLSKLACLRGARFVRASETESGQKWFEARINLMTGGDPITANFMRQNPFTYMPSFKLAFAGNHRPELRGVTDAARRRFMIVPFMSKPTEIDLNLFAKLETEYPAILRWAIEGCLDWQQAGRLVIPPVVAEATEEYLAEEDLIGRWIEARCIKGSAFKAAATTLYNSFKDFAQQEGEVTMSTKAFGSQMSQRFKKKKIGGTIFYQGLDV